MLDPALLVAALLAAALLAAALVVALNSGRVVARSETAPTAPELAAPAPLRVVVPAQRSASPTRHRARHRSSGRRPHTHPSWDLAPAGAHREPAPRYLLGTVDDTFMFGTVPPLSTNDDGGYGAIG